MWPEIWMLHNSIQLNTLPLSWKPRPWGPAYDKCPLATLTQRWAPVVHVKQIEFLRKQNKYLNIHWLAIKNSISLNFISVLAVIINFGFFFFLQAPNNVPTYTLSGNALALQYFQVNPSTGVVSLYKDLRDDTATSYTVSKLIKYNWNQIYDDN